MIERKLLILVLLLGGQAILSHGARLSSAIGLQTESAVSEDKHLSSIYTPEELGYATNFNNFIDLFAAMG